MITVPSKNMLLGFFFVFQSGIIRHCSKHLQDNLLQNSKIKQKSSPSEYYATQPVLLPLPVAVVAAYLEVQMGSYVRYQMLEYLGYFQMWRGIVLSMLCEGLGFTFAYSVGLLKKNNLHLLQVNTSLVLKSSNFPPKQTISLINIWFTLANINI